MPSCPVNSKGSAVIAQQLFLGASIISFNNNTGWGGSPSRLSVELINDNHRGCKGLPFTINGSYSAENHYYDCLGNDCYIDENGDPFESGTSKEQIVPGKVYHVLRDNNLVSKYWNNPDPGFFGDATYINPQGNYIAPTVNAQGSLTPDPFSYNIIGAPVYFRFGSFSFGGFITSWERQNRLQTATYSVEISSADNLLENSKVILDHYSGAIFGKTGASYGSPVNYTGNGLTYYGKLTEGNIPNVFNVYGFLESYGFGASAKNEQGIPLTYALNTLSLLTSITNTNDLNNKKAFSPFGRIIAPTVLTNVASPMPTNFGDMGFGLVPSILDANGVRRSAFCLDLSEIPRPPLDIRISASDSSMSVLDLIRQACDKTGKDFYTVILRKGGHNIIKIKTVDRRVSVSTNSIADLVRNLEDSGINTISSSYGKEQNRCSPRVMYIGGNQQRLHQVKSYTLAYSQTNFVYNPVIEKFVDYNRFNNKHSVIKSPNFLSTKNSALNKAVLGTTLSELWDGNETIRQQLYGDIFNQNDPNFSDSNIGGDLVPWVGNSFKSVPYGGSVPYQSVDFNFKPVTSDSLSGNNTTNQTTNNNNNQTPADANTRYIPLNDHAICPFFGYRNNEQVSLSETDSNIFRYIRPVFLDRWTGQLAIAMTMNELPVLSLGSMPNIYSSTAIKNPFKIPGSDQGFTGEPKTTDPPPPKFETNEDGPKKKTESTNSRPVIPFGFKITESELRAALAGVDSYFSYCLVKQTEKPDLFLMLVELYKRLNKFFVTPDTRKISPEATRGFSPESNVGTQPISPPDPKAAERNRLLDINFGNLIHFEFMSDLNILVDFIKDIAAEYYGRKYLVRLPEVSAYRDQQFANINIPSADGTVAVYQGSGKIFYDKELSDGAWEEYGNVIDDNIIVGGPAYYKLVNDKGLIQPILGYNASFNYDDVSKVWCELTFIEKMEKLGKTPPEDGDTPLTPKQKERKLAQAFKDKTNAYINCSKKIVPSIDFAKLPSSYVLIDTNDTRQDAFGRAFTTTTVTADPDPDPVPQKDPEDGDEDSQGGAKPKKKQSTANRKVNRSSFSAPSKKLYISTRTDNNIVFLNPYNLTGARAVIDSPGIPIFSTSYSYAKDPGMTVTSNAAIEDMAILQQQGLLTPEKIKIFASYCIPILDGAFLVSEDSTNQSIRHAMLANKMAQPFFAAIPVKSNIFCYGPWTNYPKLNNQNEIFPGLTNTDNHIEQMIAETKVEQNTDFVPWNYGGSAYLDQAVLNKMAAEATFQTVMENGQISIFGTPVFGMSGGLQPHLTDNDAHNIENQRFSNVSYIIAPKKTYSESYAGLVISSINTSISPNNVSTNYTFRTFSQKLGLYNKENADRLRKFSSSRISFAKKIADAQQEFERKITSQIDSLIKSGLTSRKNQDISSFQSKLFGTSPCEVLIGNAKHYMPAKPISTKDPGLTEDIIPDKFRRHETHAGMYMKSEIVAELVPEYGRKSAMSMDGIFSPVSFYPTDFGSTYALSSRCVTDKLREDRVTCPKCFGSNSITVTLESGREYKSPCPLCTKSKLVFPSGDPEEQEDDTALPEINVLSLNPIVVPYGEFKNPNAQPATSGERLRHSITAIANSEFAPRDFETFSTHLNLFKLYNPTNGKFAVESLPEGEGLEDPDTMEVMNLSDAVNKDYYEYDLSHQLSTGRRILLNQRFFGLRGPLMLHGWGYDTEGYPVPNMADQPKEVDGEGRPKRFFLTSSGTNDLTRDGAFIPAQFNASNGFGGVESRFEALGDIIGKGYSFENGEWIKTKTKYFHLNWAERPDLWPVGPIDLRWDEERKVWTGGGEGGCTEGEVLPPYIITNTNDITVLNNFINKNKSKEKNKCPYKMVYITLEENMTLSTGMSETHPARAFIDDMEYSLEPLLGGYRRLVFVKDRCGYTAPRGAKLLCRYDTFSGFYEPVSKQPFIVFGSISGGNSAVIELTYVQGAHRPENAPRSTIAFDNTRFNFTINSGSSNRGMFLFENGKWILVGCN